MQDIMTPQVQQTSPGTTAEAAWTHMRDKDIRHLVVTDGARVVGIVSARDLGGPRDPALRRGRNVADVMAVNVVTAAPRTTVREAANLLRGHVIGCLPILDGKKLVGIVTVTDLLELLGRGIDRPAPGPKRVMKDRGARKANQASERATLEQRAPRVARALRARR